VVTPAQGHFEARETLLRCDCKRAEPHHHSCPTVGSEQLSRLVPAGQSFGYDLIVYVGVARYLGGKQRKEIREDLQLHGIKIGQGSISKLSDRFLVYLDLLHRQRTAELRAALRPGYALHLDATCDSGKGGLFACMDGLRGWVLEAERISTENADLLAPVVERTVERFGTPVATMRDLGKAMAGAVRVLREQGVPDLICHYHFLRAVGTRLLGQPYDRLRTMLRHMALRGDLVRLRRDLRRYRKQEGADDQGRFGPGRVRDTLLALVHWLIEGGGGKNPDFPFALPHLDLVLRCGGVSVFSECWLPRPWNQPERRAMRALDSIVHRPDKDHRMAPTITELRQGWKVFCELRTVLRLSDGDLPGSRCPSQLPVPAAELLRLEQIRLAVCQYESDLRQRAGADALRKRPEKPESIVLRYLQTYRDNLFGHPAVCEAGGEILAVVARTNNPAEHFFGRGKQQLRRRLGRANLGRDLQQQPAQAALAANLRHPDYVRIVCGSLANLPDTFARLERSDFNRIRLERDHRDSRLDRLVAELVNHSPPPANLRLPPPSQDFALCATES